jgi:large subunit ribosomal protein L10
MNREEKSATIQEIAAQIEGAEAIFAVDYRGISVPQAAELRGKLRETDSSFRIVKNRLTKIAAAAAKAITTFNKTHAVLTYKGGYMGETILDEAAFTSIARLPAYEVLIGQFAGVVASPLTGLVRGLGALIGGLALQLGQIAEQGLVTGEAPAAAPAEAEAPTEEPAAETSTEEAPPEEPQADAPAEDAAPAAEADAPVEEAPTEAASGNEPPADQAEAPKAEGDDNTSEDSNKEEG